MAVDADGLAFRDTAREALELARRGPEGALEAADLVLSAAERYKKELGGTLSEQLAPFLDERGRPEDAYRSAIRRLEERHHRQVRRAERDYVDRVLLGASALVRDRIVVALGGDGTLLLNPDLPAGGAALPAAAGAMLAIEQARAALAEDLNLNTRLVLEQAFLQAATQAAA
jgi:hypothetical protein